MCDQQDHDGCRCRIERVPNFAQPRLLLALAKRAVHGYELIGLLGEEGGTVPDPGNFYRMLRMLEEEGLIASNWDTQNAGPARRVYEITEQGVEYLHAWAVTIGKTQAALGRFLTEYRAMFPK